MSEVLKIYTRIILEFLVELYVFYFLTFSRLKRRKKFVLKQTVSLAIIAAVAFFMSWVYTFIGNNALGRIGIYLSLFMLTTLQCYYCFDESYKTILFCCSVAYAAQNFTYKLFVFLLCIGEQARLFESWGSEYGTYYRLIYYPFFALTATVIYIVMLRRVKDRLSSRDYNMRMLMISVAVLGITVILCSFEDVYFAGLSAMRENRFDSTEYFILRQTGNVLSVVCLIVVMFLTSLSIRQRDLQQEVEYLQHAVRQGEWQYKMSKDIVDNINIKCHDIKYKINAVLRENGQIAADAINDINESIAIYDTNTDTGNALLNVMFSEKRLYCEQNGIIFSCMADGSKLSFIEDGDLYCLCGNILDNALEAVRDIAEKERRVINLVIKCKNDMILIQEDNYFDGDRRFEDGLPLTTKEDKRYHGFGMRSINMIVHKYDGELSSYTDGDVFHLNIIFAGR